MRPTALSSLGLGSRKSLGTTPQCNTTCRRRPHCAAASDDMISISMKPTSLDVHAWTEEYQQQSANSTDPSAAIDELGSALPNFLLPIMPLGKVKLPTETVQLQIFEPRYRLMFRLINRSRNRRFGVALHESDRDEIHRVGALCELTHYIPVPERKRIFISARIIGRYRVEGNLISDKPFAVGRCSLYYDRSEIDKHRGGTGTGSDTDTASEVEARVWNAMLDIRRLASKLFQTDDTSGLRVDEAFSLETRRWAPDADVRKRVHVAVGSDPVLMQAVSQAGLLGDESTIHYSQREGFAEYICSEALREFSEEERMANFSFCLLRSMDTSPKVRLGALICRSTLDRLRMAEAQIIEGRNYLAARSALKDIM